MIIADSVLRFWAALSLFFLSFCSAGAHANTTVLVLWNNKTAIIAADFKVFTFEKKDAWYTCKLHITNDIVWATTGIWRDLRGPFDLWSIATSAIESGGTFEEIVDRFNAAAVSGIKEYLTRFKASNPQAYETLVSFRAVVTIVFLQQTTMRTTYFMIIDPNDPNSVEVVSAECPGSTCAVGNAGILAMGQHEAINAELNQNTRIVFRERGVVGAINYLIGIQSAATPEYVAPPVDILEIDQTGGPKWLQKGSCDQEQKGHN